MSRLSALIGEAPPEVVVVLSDLFEPLAWHATAPSHVLQERHDLPGRSGPPKERNSTAVNGAPVDSSIVRRDLLDHVLREPRVVAGTAVDVNDRAGGPGQEV